MPNHPVNNPGVETDVPEEGLQGGRPGEKPVENLFLCFRGIVGKKERMQRLPDLAERLNERLGRFFRRDDGGLDDQELVRHIVKPLEREDEVLEVINEAQRERDIEPANRSRIEVVNGKAPK